MPAERDFRSQCPIASTLDIVGDRWTLLILRDMANGKKRFAEFQASPEHIASNILTARLTQMEAQGLIKSRLYQHRPKRYEYAFTPLGASLITLLQRICVWGSAELPNRWQAPAAFMRLKPADLV